MLNKVRAIGVILLALCSLGCIHSGAHSLPRSRLALSESELADRIKGGWAGQMIGVSVGAATEFRAQGTIYDKPLAWDALNISEALRQDDLYVEMTFAEVMDRKGLDAATADYVKAFRDSKYALYHANKVGRNNLRNGIMPPVSGDPAHNVHWRDIDFQIEADFIGLMCPGLPVASNTFCDRIGHTMNYGLGVDGGRFIAGMYCAAFGERKPEKIVQAGLAVLAPQGEYAQAITDLLRLYRENPADWKATWAGFNKLWDNKDLLCPGGAGKPYNIDAHVNGAYVVIGLLYGGGDFKRTVEIATACGQDSDCNAASAGGIVGTMLGYDRLPEDWRGALEKIKYERFQFTNYSFSGIWSTTFQRAKENIRRAGGTAMNGRVTIAKQRPVPAALEVWRGEFKKTDEVKTTN